MAKIQLSSNVKLEIEDETGKVIKTFNVTYKEPTKKQSKDIAKDNKKLFDLNTKNEVLTQKIESLEKKIDAYVDMNMSKEILLSTKQLDKLYVDRVKLETEFEAIGGMDSLFDISKTTFNITVGGKDKEALREFVEDMSDYDTVINSIANDAKEQMGKSNLR